MKSALHALTSCAVILTLAGCSATYQCPADEPMHHSAMKHEMNSHTGNVDIDFARNMIPHHQMAVDMAEAQLRDGHDPYLNKMSLTIIRTQTKEIQDLQNWLDRNDK